jgi:hypothetical protein
MSVFEQYYDLNPIAVIDQNQWDYRYPEVALKFRDSAVYTPLVDWTSDPQKLGVMGTIVTELIEGDTNADEIPMSAMYIDAMSVDSRSRTYSVKRYGGKVQIHKYESLFNQWKGSGGRDWRPLLRGLLGNDILRKHEILARNIYLASPTSRWTYAGGKTNIAGLLTADKFDLDIVLDWNFRLGNTGSPVIPGDAAAAKVCIIPPGVTYDLRKQLATATTNEAQMFRDARLYAGQSLRYEIGEFSGVRFVEAPNDKFGINPAVLYNVGAISKQWGVSEPILSNSGSPDPETTKVDEIWSIGQKNVTHYIQLEAFAPGDFAVNDIVTIHTRRTDRYGVTNGVDPLDGTAIHRRVVAVDETNYRLSFDRPILMNYNVPIVGSSVSGSAVGTFYAFVTKGRCVGMALTLGSRGGVLGATAEPLQFYEPKPIDDFDSVWRFTYDMVLGHNVWEPNFFELHFCAVSLPKPGGIMST